MIERDLKEKTYEYLYKNFNPYKEQTKEEIIVENIGECVLDSTGGICPHTECPKGLLNGPCGGVAHGMCEVNIESECAWVRIYKRLEKQGRLHALRNIAAPKNHSAGTRPRKVLLRESGHGADKKGKK